MPQEVLISLVNMIGTVLGLLITGVMTYFIAKLKQKAAEAAVKVGVVADTLQENTDTANRKMDDLAKVAHDTHVLVNNNMAIQLRLNAANARFRADTTKGHADLEAASLAESMLADHERKQAIVDKGNAEKENIHA